MVRAETIDTLVLSGKTCLHVAMNSVLINSDKLYHWVSQVLNKGGHDWHPGFGGNMTLTSKTLLREGLGYFPPPHYPPSLPLPSLPSPFSTSSLFLSHLLPLLNAHLMSHHLSPFLPLLSLSPPLSSLLASLLFVLQTPCHSINGKCVLKWRHVP